VKPFGKCYLEEQAVDRNIKYRGNLTNFHVTRMVDKRGSRMCLTAAIGVSGIERSISNERTINTGHCFVSPDVSTNKSCASKKKKLNATTEQTESH
jgi:hypothetical protein